MSKIGKAFMSLILDKKAIETMEVAAHQKASAKAAAPPGLQPPLHAPFPPARQPSVKEQLDAKLDAVQNRPERGVSPTRQQLIQDALRMRANKQQEVLEDLTDEQRLKLQVLAMRAMMPPKGN